jgi:erythromycin esterase-like protein
VADLDVGQLGNRPLAEWLRDIMIGIKKDKVGFYGLDVYSLWESFDEVLKYLENKDLTIKRPP